MLTEQKPKLGVHLIGHDGSQPSDGDRIIAISDPSRLLGDHFNGMIIDDKGSVKVGGFVLSASETGPALVRMVEFVTNMAVADKRIEDKETFCRNIYTHPDLLAFRTTVLETVVEDMRNNPEIPTA